VATHHHIHWSTGTLDWECFETRHDAEVAANQLVKTGETFVIEEYAEGCPRCRRLEQFYRREMREPGREPQPAVKSSLPINRSRAKPYFHCCPAQNGVGPKPLPWLALLVIVLSLIAIWAWWMR
jgi:hypothetical protein